MKVLYPGTFDPWHNGHQQVLVQAQKSFGEVVVGIPQNPDKKVGNFEFIKWTLAPITKNIVQVPGLTIETAKKLKCSSIIRGLRNIGDCNHEFKLADWNMELGSIPTWFLYGDPKYSRISSTSLKQLEAAGVDIMCYFPDPMVYYRWKLGRKPKNSLYFGQISCGKSTYLKGHSDTTFDLDKEIWQFFTSTQKQSFKSELTDVMTIGNRATYYQILEDMDVEIDWDKVLDPRYSYEASALGSWWNIIPNRCLAKFNLVKITVGTASRKQFIKSRKLSDAKVEMFDLFYKDPPIIDKTITINVE